VRGHPRKDFPIEAFLIEADASPMGHVLKELIGDTIDHALSFARTRASGDELTAHEIFH
jgi:hypothetical protein